MKIAIVGSRGYAHKNKVLVYVEELPGDTVVISGCGPDVDTWAENHAKKCGLQLILLGKPVEVILG